MAMIDGTLIQFDYFTGAYKWHSQDHFLHVDLTKSSRLLYFDVCWSSPLKIGNPFSKIHPANVLPTIDHQKLAAPSSVMRAWLCGLRGAQTISLSPPQIAQQPPPTLSVSLFIFSVLKCSACRDENTQWRKIRPLHCPQIAQQPPPTFQAIIHLQCHQMFCMWRLCTPQAEHLVCSFVSNCLFLGSNVSFEAPHSWMHGLVTLFPNKGGLTFNHLAWDLHTRPVLKSYSHFR